MSDWDEYRRAKEAMDLGRQLQREGGVEQFKRNREDALRIADQKHVDPKEIVRSVTRAQEVAARRDIARVVQHQQVVKAEDIRRLYELMNNPVRIPDGLTLFNNAQHLRPTN